MIIGHYEDGSYFEVKETELPSEVMKPEIAAHYIQLVTRNPAIDEFIFLLKIDDTVYEGPKFEKAIADSNSLIVQSEPIVSDIVIDAVYLVSKNNSLILAACTNILKYPTGKLSALHFHIQQNFEIL